MPWHRLDRELSIHTKSLVLVAGAPTSGKSVFALNLALSLDMPVLYSAQDSAPSVYARMAALTLGAEISWVYDQLRDEDAKQGIIDELKGEHPNLFITAGSLSVTGIDQRLEALEEVLGLAPPLVIIDNLIDMVVEGYNHTEMGFYATVLNELKQMSMRRNVCVMALHHVTRRGGEYSNPHGLGTRALKMTDLWFAGEREAEHVIGIYHNITKDRVYVQMLKQRDGDADPEGGLAVPLVWHPKLARLGRL